MSFALVESPRLIVVSVDGLIASSLGCFGCSWNETPDVDAMAAQGCVWDRLIATSDDPHRLLASWWRADHGWWNAGREFGAVELLTDDPVLADASCVEPFDEVSLLSVQSRDSTPDAQVAESEGASAAEEIWGTRFGQLIAAATQRLSTDPSCGAIWLHSRFLNEAWDAPRDADADGFVEDEEPLAPEEEDFESSADDEGIDVERLPLFFETTAVPRHELASDEDPDLLTAWMRTYAFQVRLIDQMIGVLSDTVSEDTTIVLTSTGGFSLGQNGWIARRDGALRNCHVRLPMVVNRGGPLRNTHVTSSDDVPEILAAVMNSSGSVVSDEQWCEPREEFLPCVTTESAEESRFAKSCNRWFLVREDNEERLYLMPDDVDTVNDVARLRQDVVDRMLAPNES